MAITIPYHRIYREFIERTNSGYSSANFMIDRKYAISPENYMRSFLLIQKDILNLFEYIEPCDTNLSTFSYRIHELFMRVCIEVEANFKAIFKENIFSKEERYWTIKDYRLINKSHHLSSYKAIYPVWKGDSNTFTPFESWIDSHILPWYDDYNKCKHDRHSKMELANLDNLLNSFTALFILLTSQFNTHTYEPGSILYSAGSNDDYYHEGDFGIGDYLLVHYPKDWTDDEKYDFDWSVLKNEKLKYQHFNYDELKMSLKNNSL